MDQVVHLVIQLLQECLVYNAPTAQYNYKPVVDIPNSIAQYQDMQVRQAQYDNLRAQNDVIQQQGVLKSFLAKMAARKNFGEDMFSGISPNRKGTIVWSQMNDDLPPYLQAMRDKYDIASHQLDFAKGRVGYQTNQAEKLVQDMKKSEASTEFTKLQNEWYVTKMIAQFGLGLANTISKTLPSFRTRGFTGSLKPNANDGLRNLGRGRFGN